MLKDKKNFFGLIIFGILVLVFVLILGKMDEPEIIYDEEPNKSFIASGIVLLNSNNRLIVRPMNGVDNVVLSIDNPNIQEGDFIEFDYIDNFDVEDYKIYSQIDVNIIRYKSLNYYDETLIASSRELKDYEEFNLQYDNEFFDNKNLYIARSNACPSEDIFGTYYKNNTIYFLEDDYTNTICTQEIGYEYYIIEVDKDYRIKNNEVIRNTWNRNSFYSSFSNTYRLDIYLFKKNNTYMVGFLGDNYDSNIAPYLRSLPLTLDEAKIIYERLYKNKTYRLINYDNLTIDEIELIKAEIGVE